MWAAPGQAITHAQTTLPFSGLVSPAGVAVDGSGDVFVADNNPDKPANPVVELAAGGAQITPPFTGLQGPSGVAVDRSGDVFVADTDNDRFTVDLTVDRPDGEAAFARTAARALPPRTLAAVEIGNEPDLYAGEPWLDGRRPRRPGRPPWTAGYTPSVYRYDYIRYARAIRHVLPHVAFQAPDITSLAPAWLQAPEGLGSLSPRLIAIHRYPLCYCLSPASPLYPTVARLLNYRASALLASSLQFAVPYAAAHHAKLVVSEFNAIACAGKGPPIRSIATALWGLDTMFDMVKEGVAGVDWHVRPGWRSSPFSFGPHGITVAPERYAMVIFAELERSGARVLTTSTQGTGASSIVLWAVSRAGHHALLLLNKTPRPAAANRQPAGRPRRRPANPHAIAAGSRPGAAARSVGQ